MLERSMAKARERRRTGEGGMTLIELLVVIAILGILAAIVVFAVGGITDKGQNAADKTTCATIHTAEEASFANGSGYKLDGGGTTGQEKLKAAGFLRTVNPSFTIGAPVAPDIGYTITGPGC